MDEKKIAEILSTLDNVEIRFSTSTKKFYADLKSIDIKEGNFLKSVCYHKDTSLETLQVTLAALVLADRIVKNAYGEDRKEYMWNGDKFEEF